MQANYCYLDHFFWISCKLHILKGVQPYPVSMKMDGFSWNFLHNASHHRQGKTMMVLTFSINFAKLIFQVVNPNIWLQCHCMLGLCKTWTLDWTGLDCWLDWTDQNSCIQTANATKATKSCPQLCLKLLSCFVDKHGEVWWQKGDTLVTRIQAASHFWSF